MKKYRTAIWVASVVLLLVGAFGVSHTFKAAAPDDKATDVSELFSEARTRAFQLREDADLFESFTQSELTWESHAAAIDGIKGDVNTVGRTLTRLNEARPKALPCQKTAIDRITRLLNEMTLNIVVVIEHLNKSPEDLHSEAYRDYLEANADWESHLASLIGDSIDCGKTKERSNSSGRPTDSRYSSFGIPRAIGHRVDW